MEFAAFLSLRDSPLTWCFDSTFRQFFPSSLLLDGCRDFFSFIFFFPCTAFGNETLDTGTLFPHQHSLKSTWSVLRLLFVFDLIAPFRVGCTNGKQEPAPTSQSQRSADTFSQVLHSSQHPKDFWCFKGVEVCRGSKPIPPAILHVGVVQCCVFHPLSYEEISQCYKSHLFYYRSPPARPAEGQSNAGVILPTYNDLHIKPRGQQPTLFRDVWFLYL